MEVNGANLDQDPLRAEQPDDQIPDGGVVVWLQVVSAFCVNLTTWGVINMYGVYQTYYQSHKLSNESESNIAWIGSLQGGLLLIICFFAGPIYDVGYFNGLMYTGAVLVVVGMMMTSICKNYWQILLAQGVAVGIGSGLLYLPGASVISQYFEKKRTFAFGIASVGSNIGGIIYPVVFRQLQPSIGFGWATRTIAFIQVAALIVPIVCMRQRIPSTTFRRLLDWELLKEKSFLLLMIGMLFGYMGIYISFFYIQIYALAECNTSANLASYLLTIVNTGSLFGRVLPNYLADGYIGPMNMHISFSIAAALLAFCWIAIKNTAGLVAFGVLYGFFSGSFVSLGGPIVFSLTKDPSTMGTRLGMLTGMCGIGLLVGNPIAGAILDHGSWIGLQAWAGSLILAAAVMISWARFTRYGSILWIKV
ncbi:hypothetical protein MMC28_008835 [Mycoblastus sanguinarius]|nr:hypothetical protein [Mycoblastus sanguinarius]